ncbi:hypothetical protein WN55_00321 [Dufourea novaeangliae]|uniref:Uncharacterized protein n=1 Tax=Dufourea novaeangliae TaxID=178035 RepID=A0A154PCK4_DUFNO|nr:hypothetical protein WN55_00321 [Dufourea novaeangliae]
MSSISIENRIKIIKIHYENCESVKTTYRKISESINLLPSKFSDRIISRNSAVNWSSRPCDLTPLGYFLWVYVKDQVYADNSRFIEALKTNIRRVIDEIEPQLCINVIKNFNERIDVCNRGRGGYSSVILFDS